MKIKNLSLLLVLSSLIIHSSIANALSFSDVPESYLYYKSINNLTNKGCIGGYPDRTFKPENEINRVESLTVILKCLDLPNIYTEQKISAPKGTKLTIQGKETILQENTELSLKIPFEPSKYSDLTFRDIDNTEWFVPVLKEAIVRQVITGYNDNTIRPNQTVSKAELYTILYRLTPKELQEIQTKEPLADDIASGYWFYTPLQFALENKLLTNDKDNLINPHRSLTRGQVTHFVYEYSQWLNKLIVTENTPTSPDTEQTQVAQNIQPDTKEKEKQEDEPSVDLPQESDVSSSQNTTNSNNSIQVGFTESGVASYYGYSFDGRRTASGELLDTATFMAAHKTLPFGTIIRVTNEQGFYVDCRVVDRGPFVEGRIVDLTPAAFEVLAPLSKGLAKVTIEVISLP